MSAVVVSLLAGARSPRANRINGWLVPNILVGRARRPKDAVRCLPVPLPVVTCRQAGIGAATYRRWGQALTTSYGLESLVDKQCFQIQEDIDISLGLDNFSVCTCMLRLCYARKKLVF